MDSSVSAIQRMHEDEGIRRIKGLERKIETTLENIGLSEGIIGATPSNAERDRLISKNKQRRHAIGSMNKEIRDIEQTMAVRGREVSS